MCVLVRAFKIFDLSFQRFLFRVRVNYGLRTMNYETSYMEVDHYTAFRTQRCMNDFLHFFFWVQIQYCSISSTGFILANTSSSTTLVPGSSAPSSFTTSSSFLASCCIRGASATTAFVSYTECEASFDVSYYYYCPSTISNQPTWTSLINNPCFCTSTLVPY